MRQSNELKLIGSAIEKYQGCAALFANFESVRAEKSIEISPQARKEMDELLYMNSAEPKSKFRNATERLQYAWRFKKKLEEFKDRYLEAHEYLNFLVEAFRLRKFRSPEAPQLGVLNACENDFSTKNDVSACQDNNINGSVKYANDFYRLVMKTNAMQCISVLPGAIDVFTSAMKDRIAGQE